MERKKSEAIDTPARNNTSSTTPPGSFKLIGAFSPPKKLGPSPPAGNAKPNDLPRKLSNDDKPSTSPQQGSQTTPRGKPQEKVGVLMKKNVFGNWKPRRFVLSNGVLRYGPTDNPNFTKIAISLEGCVVQPADAITNRPFSFGIFGPKLKQPILLLAKDVEEEKSWVEALKGFCKAVETKMMNLVDTLEGINDCIIISSEKGVIISLNKAARELFGYSRADTIGKNVSMFMPDTYHALHDQFISRYLESGENRVIGRTRRLSGKKKDGTIFPIQLNLGELSTPEGIRFIATIRPVLQITTYKTTVVLQDTRRVLDDKVEALKNSIDFEFNQLKERIMELEEERKKYKQKTNDIKFQLMMQTKWRALAELKLSNEQKRIINERLKLEGAAQENIPAPPSISVTLPGEKQKHLRKKLDYWSKLQLETLWIWLPPRVQILEAQLLFTTEEHGRSVRTFYNRVADEDCTVMIIKTDKDQVFGAFCSHAWRYSTEFYGNGECFLFTLSPQMGKYGWKSSQSPYFMMGNYEEILCGGGATGYGLRLNLEKGWSQRCDTFHNEPLGGNEDEPFNIAVLQVYGFK